MSVTIVQHCYIQYHAQSLQDDNNAPTIRFIGSNQGSDQSYKNNIYEQCNMCIEGVTHFLSAFYVQDSYSQLDNLAQGNMSVECTKEFEKLSIKFDI